MQGEKPSVAVKDRSRTAEIISSTLCQRVTASACEADCLISTDIQSVFVSLGIKPSWKGTVFVFGRRGPS
jgi:hypothetical protein